MRRTKTLIILDDIWEGMRLSRVGIPSHKELQKCNSKILLTTRIRNVCHAMECQRKITLNILSEQDSWALFVSKARRSFESSTFESVAKKVARECRGLPIALITVARALGDKDFVDWRRAAQRLEKSQTANPDDKGEASKCIKLSYDYLEDEDYKSYFLLLFRYGIRTRLFRDAETLMEAREQADSVVKHLKYSCLLLDSEEDGCVRMHDVVRDTALQIAESEDGHGFFGERVLEVTIRSEYIPKYVELKMNLVEFDICIGYSYEPHKRKLYDRYRRISMTSRVMISDLPEWFRDEIMNKAETLYHSRCQRLIDALSRFIIVDLIIRKIRCN